MTTDLNTSWEYWTPEDISFSYSFKESTPLDMVEEFRTKFSQDKDPILYERLIHEEFFEWSQEWNGNLNGEADVYELKELADVVYVIYGYANARGWDLDEALKRVHKNNMDRCIQEDGTIKRQPNGKIVKNPNAKKVDLGDLV